MPLKTICCLLFVWLAQAASGQTLGGGSVYNFLKLPVGAQVAALGGKQVSSFSADLSLVAENPSLLNKQHHGMVSASFNRIVSGITALQGQGAYYHEKSNTSFSLGVVHLLYGEGIQTDVAGNSLGAFRAYDQAISASVSKAYGNRWRYGASVKWIHANYGSYRSSGIAADVGLSYFDEQRKFKMGFVARNMGVQFTTFGGQPEDLPFDLVIGLTKQLEKAPLRFSITAQRIHQFDLLYNDTLYNNANFGRMSKTGLLNKLFSHFVFGTEVLLGEKVVILAGYNVLRSNELRIQNLASGLTGFSYGLQLNLNRLRCYYARSHYQSTLVQNQLTLAVRLVSDQK